MSYQATQNVVYVDGIKRTAYKVLGSPTALNPNEKSARANGWIVTTWCEPGHCVVAMCGGSGSMMEAAMNTGMSCLMFEKDGTNSFHLISFR